MIYDTWYSLDLRLNKYNAFKLRYSQEKQLDMFHSSEPLASTPKVVDDNTDDVDVDDGVEDDENESVNKFLKISSDPLLEVPDSLPTCITHSTRRFGFDPQCHMR